MNLESWIFKHITGSSPSLITTLWLSLSHSYDYKMENGYFRYDQMRYYCHKCIIVDFERKLLLFGGMEKQSKLYYSEGISQNNKSRYMMLCKCTKNVSIPYIRIIMYSMRPKMKMKIPFLYITMSGLTNIKLINIYTQLEQLDHIVPIT